ncbi:hypothetical protein [Haloglomus litoreum]|uniref:hypothetical protein n=1 Tax=Haloglomus litoreum TaxID=3034026 RepID=UPI0023E7D9AD|nr:hypothetical protein [Haloglomus sp. DT116]
MRRRAALRALGATAVATTTALSGCLSTLGVTQTGRIRAKYVVVETANGRGRIVYDAIDEARTIARAHRDDFQRDGPLVVSQPLGNALEDQYAAVDYLVEHDCAPDSDGDGGCGEASLTRGDFNSVRLGDTAELFYRDGNIARVLSVSRGDMTPTDVRTESPTVRGGGNTTAE